MVSSWVTDLKQQKNPCSSLSPSDSKTAAVNSASPQSAAKKCSERKGQDWAFSFIWSERGNLEQSGSFFPRVFRYDVSVAPVK